MPEIEKDALIKHFTHSLEVIAHVEAGLERYDVYEHATARFTRTLLEQIFPALQRIAVFANHQTGLWDVNNKGEIASFSTLTQALDRVTAIMNQLMEEENAPTSTA